MVIVLDDVPVLREHWMAPKLEMAEQAVIDWTVVTVCQAEGKVMTSAPSEVMKLVGYILKLNVA